MKHSSGRKERRKEQFRQPTGKSRCPIVTAGGMTSGRFGDPQKAGEAREQRNERIKELESKKNPTPRERRELRRIKG